MQNQVTNHQDATNETIKQKDKNIRGLQQDNEILRIELSKHKYTVENLTKDLNDKIEELRDLMKNKRKSPRPTSSYGHKNKNVSIFPTKRNCSNSSSGCFDYLIQRLLSFSFIHFQFIGWLLRFTITGV